MARIEARPFLVSRRTALKTGGILVLGLAFSAVGVGVYEQLKEKPKEKPLTETQQNLESALELMDSFDDQLAKDAVEFYMLDQKQSFDFINSGSSTEPARVVLSIVDQERTVKIALLEDQFTNEQFQAQKAAISLFEAFYVYQKAKQDPRKFSRFTGYKTYLEREADNLASQIFSEK